MRPLFDFDNIQNTWVKDGDTDGYIIEVNIQEKDKNLALPAHPLGRVPVRIQKIYADAFVDFAVERLTENEIIMQWSAAPVNVRLRIE